MNPLVILGASTRAAAFSAIRAGFDPICGDMFADADLRAHATVLDVPHYPHNLAEAVAHLPALPWIYTGALENSPVEIETVNELLYVLGNFSVALRRSRDPWFCRDILQQAGLPALELRSSSTAPPRDGKWLLKPLRSAAGRAIAVWGAETSVLAESHYFQQLATGTSISAAFLATSESAELLGISRQLIGWGQLNAPGFGYCGSIFPWSDGDSQLEELVREIGVVISRECGLRGLFGIDLISDGRCAWLTEVNPRYTASMELIEYYWQLPLLKWHQEACIYDRPKVRWPKVPWTSQNQFYCKIVMYADRAARAPDLTGEISSVIDLQSFPRLADIPVAGTEILPGQPVFTCLGKGEKCYELPYELIQRAEEVWAQFPGL